MKIKDIDKKTLQKIKKKYDGTWASLDKITWDYRITIGMASRIVNHKGALEKSRELSRDGLFVEKRLSELE